MVALSGDYCTYIHRVAGMLENVIFVNERASHSLTSATRVQLLFSYTIQVEDDDPTTSHCSLTHSLCFAFALSVTNFCPSALFILILFQRTGGKIIIMTSLPFIGYYTLSQFVENVCVCEAEVLPLSPYIDLHTNIYAAGEKLWHFSLLRALMTKETQSPCHSLQSGDRNKPRLYI